MKKASELGRAKSKGLRVVNVSVSPDNFINWELLRATGKIKSSEEVEDVFDVKQENSLIHFRVKLKKIN